MRVEQLRQLVHEQGPFASVYLDVSHDTEDAVTQNELRWRAAESRLRENGADPATLRATRGAVLGQPAVGKAGRAVIAAHGTVLAVEDLPQPPPTDVVRFSDLPYLLPLLSNAAPAIPHVVVLADKVDGELQAVDRTGNAMSSVSVQGRDHPVHHVAGGGFAHRSMENRAEQTVKNNAKDIAERAVRLVEQVDAALVVLAGTVSARTAINTELPEYVQRLVTEVDIDANRVGLDSPELTGQVDRLLAQRQAEQDALSLDRLHTGEAHGSACAGLDGVVAALRAAAAEAVLVTDPVLTGRTVWLGKDHSQIAVRRAELPEAADELTEQRADEAIPLAALATAADVLVLSGEAAVTDGVAALLRF
jgi:hypothetical protein